MSRIVLDASAAAAWLLKSQSTPASEALFGEIEAHVWIAPAFFPVEIRAVLLKAERRGWLRRDSLDGALAWLRNFKIGVEPELEVTDLDDVLLLARHAGLGFYDALYLDLSLQAEAELATRDVGLIQAARRMGAPVRDLRAAPGLHEPSAVFEPAPGRWTPPAGPAKPAP